MDQETKKYVAIIGSKYYERRQVLKEFIFKVKEKFNNNVCIVTRGMEEGAEKWVKKYTLGFEMEYMEFNPAYTIHNQFSGNPPTYYEKNFNPTHELHQYDCVVRRSDLIVYYGTITPQHQRHLERLCKKFRKPLKYMG